MGKNSNDPATKQITAAAIIDFIHGSYLGYVHLRAAALRRPVHAFVCNSSVIAEIAQKADNDGAADGSESTNGYSKFLATINRIRYTPEGEPLRRMVDPCMFVIISCPFAN